jgi:uncharacterized membrane protein
MMTPHLLNLFIHVGTGIAAMALGFYLLWTPKGTRRHRTLGRAFAALTLVVCAAAAAGLALFRFMPLFAVLTVIVSYQLLSGWHVIYTKAAGPDRVDALLLAGACASAASMLPHLFGTDGAGGMQGGQAPVVRSTLAALAVLLAYDAARWLFPRRWHAALWRYEHIYKILGCLFGMLSAAVGNTVRVGQPWPQLAPSVLGMAVVPCCWLRTYHAQRRRGDSADSLDSQASPLAEDA